MARGIWEGSIAVVLLAGSLGLGCAAHVGEQQRTLAALERAERALEDERQRLLLVEQRLIAMEATRRLEADRAEKLELERLVARLEQILVESERVLAQGQGDPIPARAAADSAVCPAADDPRAQLRYWLERLRNDPEHAGRFRGGLSPAQLEAVNALSRGERSLDPQNPWPGF